MRMSLVSLGRNYEFGRLNFGENEVRLLQMPKVFMSGR